MSLAEHGSTYALRDEAGEVRCWQQRPEVSIAHRLAATLTRIEAEFGMTPSSRTRISATVPAQREPDEKDRFFGPPKIAEVG